MIKGGGKKSKNRLTWHRVGRVTGSTGGWPILSMFLALPGFSDSTRPIPGPVLGFSGSTDRTGPVLTTLIKSVTSMCEVLLY